MRKFIITVNGNKYEVDVEEIKPQSSSRTQPIASKNAESLEPVPTATKSDVSVTSSSNNTDKCIKAPMPGTILKVDVKVGDMVKKDSVLLILEAMKMENEIVAPYDAKISSFHVAKGSLVSAGDVLVSFE